MIKLYNPEIIKGVELKSMAEMIGMDTMQVVMKQDREGKLRMCRQAITTRKYLVKKWN